MFCCFVFAFPPVLRSMLVPNDVACGVEGNSRKGFINFQIFMEFLLIVISRREGPVLCWWHWNWEHCEAFAYLQAHRGGALSYARTN